MSRNSFIEQPIHRSPSFILNSIAKLFLLDAGAGGLPDASLVTRRYTEKTLRFTEKSGRRRGSEET